jgi:hypothetical protein
MGEVINLNRARKARAKAAKAEAAAENRTRFGRTKGERDGETARHSQDEKRLDGHRLGDDDPEPPKAG